MRIAIIASGSRGDVEPYIALGKGLKVVVPFFGDQPYRGQRAADLEVGPLPIPRKKLTAERLARAIQQAVTDPAMRQRAASLGAKIRAEDGIARAVEVVQQIEKRGGA